MFWFGATLNFNYEELTADEKDKTLMKKALGERESPEVEIAWSVVAWHCLSSSVIYFGLAYLNSKAAAELTDKSERLD